MYFAPLDRSRKSALQIYDCIVFYYPTLLSAVRITHETSTNMGRYWHTRDHLVLVCHRCFLSVLLIRKVKLDKTSLIRCFGVLYRFMSLLSLSVFWLCLRAHQNSAQIVKKKKKKNVSCVQSWSFLGALIFMEEAQTLRDYCPFVGETHSRLWFCTAPKHFMVLV